MPFEERCKDMEFRPRAATLTAFLAAARARVAALFPLGITARLSISLAAVAVLGAAANMLAQESVSIIRIRMSMPPNVPAPNLPAAPSLLIAQPAARPVALARKSLEGLTGAVDRFERVSEARAKLNAHANDDEYLSAADALGRLSPDYGDSGSARIQQTAAIARLLAEYLDRGHVLISVADERRLVRFEHARHTEAIERRLQTSLDAAWKIFGRVFARQSLLQLRAHRDSIRQHSEALLSGDAVSTADMDLLTTSENAFAASLEAHRKSLEKSEGASWVAGLREDFDALVALRTSLYGLNIQYDDELQRFSKARSLLAAAIAVAAASPAMAPQPAIPAATATEAAMSAAPAPATEAAMSAAPAPAAEAATSPASAGEAPDETAPRESDRSNRNLMAMVTTLVILFITAISILTVRSVLTPVRRILRATARVANGDMRVRVAPGGVREQGKMAGGFNAKAARP